MIRRVAILALLPSPVAAHGSLPDGGGFYAGAAHPFLAVEHFLLLLALGLLLGRVGGAQTRAGLAALGGSLLIGLVLSNDAPFATAAVLALALICGLVLASGVAIARPALALAALAGLAVGVDTGLPAPDAATSGVMVLMPWLGVLVGAFLIAANSIALAGVVLRRRVGDLVLRIAGSWLAAMALMVLSFRLSQMAAV